MKKINKLLAKVLLLAIIVTAIPLGGLGFVKANAAESYLWPVPSSKTISQRYGSGHLGLDITGSKGCAIRATKSGTVYYVYTGCNNFSARGSNGHNCTKSTCSPNTGNIWTTDNRNVCNWGYGNGVVIKHSDGSGYSMYAHMTSVGVKKGALINQGDTIGTMGSTGNSFGTHLHFELSGGGYMSGTYFKPESSINNNTGNISYADSTVHTLSVYFNANGGSINSSTYSINSSNNVCKSGSGSSFAQIWTYNKTQTYGLYDYDTFGLYKPGYVFLGWGTSPSGGTVFGMTDSSVTPYQINSNVASKNCSTTLYAIWQKYQCSFSFTGLPNTISVLSGDKLNFPTDVPYRYGYTFKGWNVNRLYDNTWHVPGKGWHTQNDINNNAYTKSKYSSGDSKTIDASWFNGIGTVTSTLKFRFEPIWEELQYYNVWFNANGGAGAPSSQKKYYGQALTIPSTVPTRDGYTFLGWSTSSTSTNSQFTAGGTIKDNNSLTLYAVWKKATYTVSYNGKGASSVSQSQTAGFGSNITLSNELPTLEFNADFYANGGTVNQTNKVIKAKFLGWNTESDGSGKMYTPGSIYAENKSCTLYAQWQYTSIGELPIPVKKGYKFVCWHRSYSMGEMGDGGLVPVSEDYIVKANLHLNALWTENTTKIEIKTPSVDILYRDMRALEFESDYDVSWSSSDNSVVSVDDNGIITGTGAGTAVVTATITDNNGNTYSDDCTVNVNYSLFQWIIRILLLGFLWY